MKRKEVESSNLASVGYDAKKKVLEIEFNHGGVYQYFDVPAKVHKELMNADSHRSNFYHNISDDYEYERKK